MEKRLDAIGMNEWLALSPYMYNITLTASRSTMFTRCLKTLLLMIVVIAYLCLLVCAYVFFVVVVVVVHLFLVVFLLLICAILWLFWRIHFRLTAVKFEFHTWEKWNVAHALVFAGYSINYLDVYISVESKYTAYNMRLRKEERNSNYGLYAVFDFKQNQIV